MSIQLKLRRGTTAQHSTFTGVSGEVTVDTDKKTLVVHDGTTVGGNPVLPAVNPSYSGTLTGGTGVVNLGSGQFYKDASGNVGIGTSSPGAKLDVAGSMAGASVTFSNFGSATTAVVGLGDGNTGLFRPAAQTLGFTANGAERMRIDSSGNVGIGTSTPTGISGYTALKINHATNGAILDLAQADTMRGRLVATTSSFVFETSGSIPILFSPAGTERARIAANGQMSTMDGAGNVKTAYDCRAWVNFNGTGTVAVRASGNVSSITDNGVGDYTVNFTTAMSDANYVWAASGNEDSNSLTNSTPTYKTLTTYQVAASLRVLAYFNSRPTGSSYNNGVADMSIMNVSVFR